MIWRHVDSAPLVHGGRLEAARRAFPGAPKPFVDLSTGINPVAYKVPALDPAVFARLPEPEAVAALQAAAANAYGAADPAMVVAAPGTQSLIQILPRLFAPARVGVVGPTYAEHEAAWRGAGHDVRELAWPEREAPDRDIVVLCNPNNPDGRRIEPSDLRARAESLGRSGGLLVVDEAFADFEPPGFSLAPVLPREGLVVLRSLGKAYGLAGLRLGFALASAPIAARLRAAIGPWAVSGPAIAIGTLALGDAAWREAAGRRLARDAARLDALLSDSGLDVLGGTSLFRLARHPFASALFDRLGHAGLLVRRFADHPEWLRFGLPDGDATFDRLRDALRPPTGAAPG